MIYDYPMMNRNNWGWGFGMMLLMSVFWIVLLAIIAFVVVRLLKSHQHDSFHKTNPLDIVKERYAKGDITKDEFEQLNKDLK